MAFRDGMVAAVNGVTRAMAIRLARAMSVRDGDAFLAGYYAEKRNIHSNQTGAK
jgi:hypothetical protein